MTITTESPLDHWRFRLQSEASKRGFLGEDSDIVVEYSMTTERWLRVIDVHWNHGSSPDDAEGCMKADAFKTEEEALSSMNETWLAAFLDEAEKQKKTKQGA